MACNHSEIRGEALRQAPPLVPVLELEQTGDPSRQRRFWGGRVFDGTVLLLGIAVARKGPLRRDRNHFHVRPAPLLCGQPDLREGQELVRAEEADRAYVRS